MNNNPLLQHLRQEIPMPFNEISLMDGQWPRLVGALQNIILPPYEVIIHPSSQCNLLCDWCIGKNVRTQSQASHRLRLPSRMAQIDNMLKVVDGIIGYKKEVCLNAGKGPLQYHFKVENVTFSGIAGEPLTAPFAVLAAMKRLSQAEIRTGLFTNGILLTENTWDILVHIDYVLVSLDAATGATYARLKFSSGDNGQAIFETVLKNIAGLIKYSKGTPGSRLCVNASFILYPENYHEVFQAAQLAKDFGVRFFRIKQDISKRRILNPEQRETANRLLTRIEDELNCRHFSLVRLHDINNPQEMNRQFTHCIISDLVAAIGSDGNIYPCNYHPDPSRPHYGNVIETTFAQVWEGADRQKLRKQLPWICPTVCDPFKNRSNSLLDKARRLWTCGGLDGLYQYRNDLLHSYRRLRVSYEL